MPSTLICDLDGVVYRGSVQIPGAGDALCRAGSAGMRVLYVTNNSTRTAGDVVDKLRSVVGVEPEERDIVTSAQAAASAIPEDAEGCYVVGGSGLRVAIEETGRQVTSAAGADCVVVGVDFDFEYSRMEEAASAIRSGATFIASNVDPTFPSANGRLRPGAGAVVAAIATASGIDPVVAGKPHKPIRELIHSRGVTSAVVVGDRVDTDIALASREPDWSSILVLTGVTGADDDHGDADHVTADISEAIDLVLGGGYGR